jgi:LCP family protein required for cell wall assembly
VLAAQGLAALTSVVLLVISGYAWTSYHSLNTGLRRLTLDTGRQPGAPASSAPASAGASSAAGLPTRTPGHDQNILVVGTDDRSDMTPAEIKLLKVGHDQGVRSDVIMIVHVPANGAQATLISIPRDSYVRIPGYGMNRINAAFSFAYNDAKGSQDQRHIAAANLVIHTVEDLTGLTMDHFVAVDFIGFYRIANAIGGVPVVLCHSVDDRFKTNQRNGIQGGSGFHMSKGPHVLTPIQSLEFVRQRHNLPGGSTDLERNQRQRYFLAAAFRKITSAGVLFNPGKLHALIDAVKHSVYVDSGFNLTSLIGQVANLSANKIVGRPIPIAGFWNGSPVGDVIRINPVEVRHKLAEWLQPANASATPAGSSSSAAPAPKSSGTAGSTSAGTSASPSTPPDRGCVN